MHLDLATAPPKLPLLPESEDIVCVSVTIRGELDLDNFTRWFLSEQRNILTTLMRAKGVSLLYHILSKVAGSYLV